MLAAFGVMLPNVELVPLMKIDEALTDVDDWELFLALHRHRDHWDGLVTNDDKLLSLPKEMTVLAQTRLTLVVAVGEGHSPIRSVGLLLCHLNHIGHHSKPDRPQIWKLRVTQRGIRRASEVPRVDRREEQDDGGRDLPGAQGSGEDASDRAVASVATSLARPMRVE